MRRNEAMEAAIQAAARKAGRRQTLDRTGAFKVHSIASVKYNGPVTRSFHARRARGCRARARESIMHEEPTAYRVPDPGVRALFTEDSRYQAWLDVEVALARAQADLGIIPAAAALEIADKAKLSLLDREAIRAGLARTGHSLVPLIWELDRVCEGDAGGYVHWGATTQNITQTGQLLLVRRAHDVFLSQLAALLEI